MNQHQTYNHKNIYQTPHFNDVKSYHEMNFTPINYPNQPNFKNPVSEKVLKLNNFTS